MSLLHDSAEPVVDDSTHRFRAPTIDAALAAARAELGPDVEIVDANRIRRGGVGGFFATDLGVELVVQSPTDRADHDERGSREHDVQEPEYLEPEYLDTSASAPRQTLPRSSRRAEPTDDRPQFYDRAAEEAVRTPAADPAPPLSPGIDRLLDSATRAERVAHGRTKPATTTFADHLAHHLGEHGPIRTESPVRADRPRPVEHSRSEDVETGLPQTPAPTEAPIAEQAPPTEIEPTPPEIEPTPTPEPDAVTPAAATPSAEAKPPTDPATRATPRRRPSTSRDSMRKPIDLAAGAVGRLVEQLSDVQPVDGSRMRDLTRLVIKVTTPDGTVIEIAAELDGARHG